MPQWILYGKKSEKNHGAVIFLIGPAINCDFALLCEHLSRIFIDFKIGNIEKNAIYLSCFPLKKSGKIQGR